MAGLPFRRRLSLERRRVLNLLTNKPKKASAEAFFLRIFERFCLTNKAKHSILLPDEFY